MTRRGILLICLMTIGCGLAAAADDIQATHPNVAIHSPWTSLLQKYVTPEGAVDYESWKNSGPDRQKLEIYLSTLSKVYPGALTDPLALSFYLNLYNASVVKLVLDHYPVKSVKKIGGWGGPWKMTFIKTYGGTVSLDEIEHGIVRPAFHEPRVHFALNCASKSCPPLRPEAFTADRLDAQLADQERIFLTDPKRNRFRVRERGVFSKERAAMLEVSEIFKWFPEDFGGQDGVAKRFVPYVTEEARPLLESGKYNISYVDYDWSLNGK